MNDLFSNKKPITNNFPCFENLDSNNEEDFFQIIRSIFPVAYEDDFYNSIINEDNCFGYIIYICSFKAGACAFSIENNVVQIMILGLLPEFRQKGFGSLIMKEIEHFVSKCQIPPVIFQLHVQTNNLAAKRFYEKNGFNVVSLVNNYYLNINPSSAFLLVKTVNKF